MNCFRNNSDNKKLTKIQKRQCIEIMLANEFPLVLCIIFVICDSILASGAIGIEIIKIIYHKELYYVGCGLIFF